MEALETSASTPMVRSGLRLLIGASLIVLIVSIVAFNQLQPPTYSLNEDFSTFLSSMRGKVIVLDVMNTQCAPCRVETQHLKEFNSRLAKYGGRVILVSVAIEWPGFGKETDERIRTFIDEFRVDWKLVRYENANEIIRTYNVFGIPTIVIIDQNGEAKLRHLGIATADALEEALKKVLGA